MPRKVLLIFLRNPVPGEVKSRLAKDVGPAHAAEVYQRLIRRTLGVASDFKHQHPEADLRICHTPATAMEALQRSFPGNWSFEAQTDGHLGLRMKRAIDTALASGAERVVLVGTDIADLTVRDLEQAFSSLDGPRRSALGPAADGGFYLIGLTESCPEAFENPEWSTEHIFARTRGLLETKGFHVAPLPMRRDIDRLEDLRFAESDPLLASTVSVIIPTLASPQDRDSTARSLSTQLWPGDELIFITPPIERSKPHHSHDAIPGVRELSAPRGRGAQMNAGAVSGRGNLVLFLHDDSIPPPNFAWHVRKLILHPECSIGCFTLRFHPTSRALNFIAGWANLRTRRLHLPYGDQGLFCRRSTFLESGGFKNRFLMEDIDLVGRFLARGRLFVVPEPTVTSPRRYIRKGILRASMENHLLYFLYRLGVNDRFLHDRYYRERGSEPGRP